MTEYSVMTVNFWADFIHVFGTKGFSYRIHAIEHLIETYHPDVIGAQEVTSGMMKYMGSILNDYAICGKQRKSLINNEANPVLYRKDRFELMEEKTLWLSDTPEKEGSRVMLSQFPRIVTAVRLKDRKTKEICTFANTHLDVNFASVRNSQAHILCRILEKEKSPVVLTGDFNSNALHESVITISQSGYRDCLTPDAGSTLRGKIGSKRFSNLPIDHIFCNDRLKPVTVRRVTDTLHGIWPSDHYPLYAVLSTQD